MRTLVVSGVGQLSVQDVELAAEPGEVVVKVADCGICATDLHALRYPDVFKTGPGTVLGHEFSGEVAELTAGVEGWAPGDRVVAMPFLTCGACQECAAGYDWRCDRVRGIGLSHLGVPGAFAEYVRTSPHVLFRIPEGLSYRRAALTEPFAVTLHSVNRVRLQPGESCVIMGAGPIGLLTVIWAKIRGAEPIVVSEPLPSRRAQALALGADTAVDPTETDPVAQLRELTKGRWPVVVFDCVGTPPTLQEATRMAARDGRVAVTGVCMEPYQLKPLTAQRKEVQVHFVFGYTHAEFREALNTLASAEIDADHLISDIIDLGAAPAMFRTLARPTAQVKVLVEPGSNTGN